MIRKKIVEHSIALVLVGVVFVLISLLLSREGAGPLSSEDKLVRQYAGAGFIDWNDPAQRAVFKDVWIIYHPGQDSKADSLSAAITSAYNSKAGLAARNLHKTELSFPEKILKLAPLYLNFLLVYIIVLVFSYYAAQTVAVWRFVQMKRRRSSYLQLLYVEIRQRPLRSPLKEICTWGFRCVRLLGLALLKGILYLILFAPAYVVAYAFKTRFDTDSILFMIVLGAFSNGLLITYTQKFFAFLAGESRKGYLQTALVKNLKHSYDFSSADGIPFSRILRFKKIFPEHVFGHIYSNARYQYLPALKEQASFLITGLIIIEMALNIQNHLCYDLLQNLFYQDYISVLIASFGIFLIIKSTEILTDVLYLRETQRYENR
jgi:hypothetical protein